MTEHTRRAAIQRPGAGNSTLIGLDFTTLDAAGSTAVGRLFRSRSAATAFAVTQAAQSSITLVSLDFTVFVCDSASLDSVSEGVFHAWDEVSVTGSVAEIACALAILDEYSLGVRRARLPLPAAVAAEISTLSNAVASPVHPSRVNDPDTVEVRVCTMRPEPLPHISTSIGLYDSNDAERVAGALAYRFAGEISPATARGRIQIEYGADVSDGDRAAVDRYTRIVELRANIAALDPRRDIETITRLDRARRPLLCHASSPLGTVAHPGHRNRRDPQIPPPACPTTRRDRGAPAMSHSAVSVPASDARLDAAHWTVGDQAVWLVCDLVPVLGAAPFREITGTVAPTVPRFGNWVSRSTLPGEPDGAPTGAWSVDVFHTDPRCQPCARGLQDTRTELTESCDRYWAQWSPRAHRRFTELRSHIDWNSIDGEPRGTFTAAADVPDWLREETAGALTGGPEASSSLLLAGTNAPIYWPSLLAAHPGEVAVPTGDAAARRQGEWPEIAEAFETIEAAGLTAYLDVCLEVDQDGGLLLEPNAVGIRSLDTAHRDVDDLSRLSDDVLELRMFNQDRVVTFARLMDSPVGAELAEKANRALTATVVEIGRRGTSKLLEDDDWTALHESAIQTLAEQDQDIR